MARSIQAAPQKVEDRPVPSVKNHGIVWIVSGLAVAAVADAVHVRHGELNRIKLARG
jgi:hypothetical protein